MNYFAHAIRFLDDPYFVAGTALPDWLAVVDRRARVPSRAAQQHLQAADETVSAVARGVVQHHRDDDWFHRSPAFTALSLETTNRVRQVLSDDDGFRPSLLGHILIEILLDAELIQDDPPRLVQYYELLDGLDALRVAHAASHLTTRPVPQLAVFVPLFSAERFLYDYADDAKLLGRLNRVLGRVGLPALEESFQDLLPEIRGRVRAERRGLFDDWVSDH
jgi:hypothetical protein